MIDKESKVGNKMQAQLKQQIGKEATIIIDPETKTVVTGWPTSTITLRKLLADKVKSYSAIKNIGRDIASYVLPNKKIKIKLTENEFNYLLSKRDEADLLKRILMVYKKEDNSYIIETTNEDADEVRNYCGDFIQKEGFDIDYKPTKEGLILESLIDKFYIR